MFPRSRYVDTLYFFSPAGNPATVHTIMECALMTTDHAVIKNDGVAYVVYDSLAIKYGGADGMYFGSSSHVGAVDIVEQTFVLSSGCLLFIKC